MPALVMMIVAGEEDAGSVESIFAQARQVAAEAEALLVDESWAEPEPVAADVATARVVDAATDEEAPEPRQSLFSWAEFMAEEPVEPKGQRRDEAPTLSLFEWALERERESSVVSA